MASPIRSNQCTDRPHTTSQEGGTGFGNKDPKNGRTEVEESILLATATGGAVDPDRIARLPAGRFGAAEPKGPGGI